MKYPFPKERQDDEHRMETVRILLTGCCKRAIADEIVSGFDERDLPTYRVILTDLTCMHVSNDISVMHSWSRVTYPMQ